MMTRGFLPLLALVIAAGGAALAWETDGLRAFTSAAARQLEGSSAIRFPFRMCGLRDQDGNAFSLEYLQRQIRPGRLHLYALPNTFAAYWATTFAHVTGDVAGTGDRAAPIDLLSISFDPQNDDREALQFTENAIGAVAPRWRIASPVHARGLAALLPNLRRRRSFPTAWAASSTIARFTCWMRADGSPACSTRMRHRRFPRCGAAHNDRHEGLREPRCLAVLLPVAAWLSCWIWPSNASSSKSDMTVHMAVQLPLLIGLRSCG